MHYLTELFFDITTYGKKDCLKVTDRRWINWMYFVLAAQTIVFVVIMTSVLMSRYFRCRNPGNESKQESSNYQDVENGTSDVKLKRTKVPFLKVAKTKHARNSHYSSIIMNKIHKIPKRLRFSHYDHVNFDSVPGTSSHGTYSKTLSNRNTTYDTVQTRKSDIDDETMIFSEDNSTTTNTNSSIANQKINSESVYAVSYPNGFNKFPGSTNFLKRLSNQKEASKRNIYSFEDVTCKGLSKREHRVHSLDDVYFRFPTDNSSLEDGVCFLYDNERSKKEGLLLYGTDSENNANNRSHESLYDRLNKGTRPTYHSKNDYDHILLRPDRVPCFPERGKAKSQIIQKTQSVNIVNGNKTILYRHTLSL